MQRQAKSLKDRPLFFQLAVKLHHSFPRHDLKAGKSFWMLGRPVFDRRTDNTVAVDAEDHVIGHMILADIQADGIGYFLTRDLVFFKRFGFQPAKGVVEHKILIHRPSRWFRSYTWFC